MSFREAGRARSALVLTIALAAVAVGASASLVLAHDNPGITAARNATARFHDLDKALAAGYGKFYICTDNEGVGTMGQHFADGSRIDDELLDERNPEVLVYEPRNHGGYQLVATEYVQLAASWDAHHANPPQLFGKTLAKIPAGNRYGLPEFYEIHAWIWRPNPKGMFFDWNPSVSCKGNGDPA
jgi:hypothetical protein